MSDEITSRLRGLGPAVQKMQTLTPKLKRKGLRKAARRAANIFRDEAKQRAKALDDPETSEKIWRNLATQEAPRLGRREGGVAMRVGVRGGASSNEHSKDASGNPGGNTRHWRYIEFGTQHTPPAPFMRPAFSSKVVTVTEKFVVEFSREIDLALQESS